MTIQNETLDVIARRSTCRAFADKPVEKKKLEAIALAGAQAPSSNNMQGWRIFVVSDKSYVDYLDELSMAAIKTNNPRMYERIMSRSGKTLYNAPVFIAIATPRSVQYSVDMDSGIVCENMVLAATALGLDTCINRMVTAGIQGPHKQEIFDTLGIPEGFEFSIGILVGYSEHPTTPHAADESKIRFIEDAGSR
jgi:nitroreductase